MIFHPFAICAFVLFGVFAYIAIRTKPDLPMFIESMNSVGAQPTGVFVLVVGCVMLVVCKTYALDSTIAGGIVGCGINMLTNQFTKQHTDSAGNTTTDTTIPSTPTPPTASQAPEVKP